MPILPEGSQGCSYEPQKETWYQLQTLHNRHFWTTLPEFAGPFVKGNKPCLALCVPNPRLPHDTCLPWLPWPRPKKFQHREWLANTNRLASLVSSKWVEIGFPTLEVWPALVATITYSRVSAVQKTCGFSHWKSSDSATAEASDRFFEMRDIARKLWKYLEITQQKPKGCLWQGLHRHGVALIPKWWTPAVDPKWPGQNNLHFSG